MATLYKHTFNTQHTHRYEHTQINLNNGRCGFQSQLLVSWAAVGVMYN